MERMIPLSRNSAVFGLNIDPIGHHNGAWRHPLTQVSRAYDISYSLELSRMADAAGLDMVFIADGLSVNWHAPDSVVLGFEPLTLLSAVAVNTCNVGLVCTVSSTFTEPYNLARMMSSLDRISHGRAAWNVVTTANPNAALNFGPETLPDHDSRYERAAEFLDVATALWTGWQADAVVADKDRGVYFDSDRVAVTGHHGRFFTVEGPLNAPRSPQGKPVIVQAGASATGRDFAARYADIVYMVSQDLEDAKAYYQDIKHRARDHGRAESDILVIMSVRVLVEQHDNAAQERAAELAELVSAEVTLKRVSSFIGVDLTRYALDDVLPPLPEADDIQGYRTQLALVRRLVQSGQVRTLRELATRLDGGQGVLSFTGDGRSVCDNLQLWFEEKAADGFMILPQQTQRDAENFVKFSLPAIRSKPFGRQRPEDTTFRNRLFG